MFLVLQSTNAKIGEVSATYLPLATCPASCPFKGAGCYAEAGNVGYHTRRLGRQTDHMTPDEIVDLEACEIELGAAKVRPGTPLRLHVSGDCTTDAQAERLTRACAGWPGPVWTYTHAWREILRMSWGRPIGRNETAFHGGRDAWGRISVFASVISHKEDEEAYRRGYNSCMVVGPDYRARGGYDCPQQTGGKESCSECGICFRADTLYIQARSGPRFRAHGAGAKRMLPMLDNRNTLELWK